MNVADLIEKLKGLPQDLPVAVHEWGSWGYPDLTIVEPGEQYDGITFDERTVMLD